MILLGDVFDVWTYPPNVRPPGMREIIAANRILLGPSGPFAKLVRAFPGHVRMLLGNHDGSLTRADIDLLNRSLGGNQARGERIELVDAAHHVCAGVSGARTVFSHGHHWCMFNAPDARSRWSTIPVGHFVTRAIGYQMARSLRPGETTADRINHGNPGVSWSTVLASLNRSDDLAAFLLTYICRQTRMPQTEPIVMPDGSRTTVREAMRVYTDLFTRWAAVEGRNNAIRAARADLEAPQLAWAAQRLAMRTQSDLVVFGHTHAPVGGLGISPVTYVNSGYECVARPDFGRGREFTFTEVDLERATARVLAVTGAGMTGARAPVMPSAIVAPAADFSCYVRIENRSGTRLRLTGQRLAPASNFVVGPPLEIAPGARADIWIQDDPGARGSGGRFTYHDGTRPLEFVVACPVAGRNIVRSPVPNYRTRTGSSPWRSGGVNWLGHPVQVRLEVQPVRTAPRPMWAESHPGPVLAAR